MPILKEHGLDLLDTHKDGFIGMHRACWGQEQRHTDTVKAFLEAGAFCLSLTHLCIVEAQSVQRLTDSRPSGVPHDYPDKNGKTPVELTRNPKTKKLLEEWAANKSDL